MRKKIKYLSIKITRQQKNLKTVSVHYKNTDLILKMIKKAKISRVRVPLKSLLIIIYSTSKHSSAHNLGSGSLRSATLVRYHPTLDHRTMGYSTLSRWIVLGKSSPATWRSCSAGRSPAWWRLLGPDPLRPSAGTCGGPWGRRWAVLTGWPPAHPAGKRSPASLTSSLWASSRLKIQTDIKYSWHTSISTCRRHLILLYTPAPFDSDLFFLLLMFTIPPTHCLERNPNGGMNLWKYARPSFDQEGAPQCIALLERRYRDYCATAKAHLFHVRSLSVSASVVISLRRYEYLSPTLQLSRGFQGINEVALNI